jgi:prepilin-type N-terminal cleavage/methylation domain-containing protein
VDPDRKINNIYTVSPTRDLKDRCVRRKMHTANGLANSKGFTLIELLIVLAILSILVGVVILSVGNVFGTARKTAYTTVQHQVQTAAVAYAIQHLGTYPLTGATTIIDGKTLGIVDVCALLLNNNPDGLLGEIPDGLISYQDDDNCDSSVYNCSCDAKAHYIWAIDLDGNVYSSCVNTVSNKGGCKNTGSDGFQDIWP